MVAFIVRYVAILICFQTSLREFLSFAQGVSFLVIVELKLHFLGLAIHFFGRASDKVVPLRYEALSLV